LASHETCKKGETPSPLVRMSRDAYAKLFHMAAHDHTSKSDVLTRLVNEAWGGMKKDIQLKIRGMK